MSRSVYTAGVLRERWDDTTRLYTAFDAAGAQTSQRAYTAAENAQADADAAALLLTTNEKTLRDGIAASITALKADIDLANLDIAATNATINANPAQYIKNLERALKNTDRAVLRLLKIVSASYSDTDLGAA